MNYRLLNKIGQFVAVVGCAGLIKWYYATANVNELRWILAPTAGLVELISGTRFAFESYTGYMSSDHTFVIAASCAGVNFLITAFLMLSLRKLWSDRVTTIAWRFFPIAMLFAYGATIVANTVRISSSLLLRGRPLGFGLNANQLHRFEGIVIYFGFLLLIFVLSERMNFGGRLVQAAKRSTVRVSPGDIVRQTIFPLVVYYATTLGIPLANGAYRQGSDFVEHALFVLVIPLLLMLPVIAVQLCRQKAKSAAHI